MQVTIKVNGDTSTVDVAPRMLLVHLIREKLGLTGTNIGCDTTNCGACTVSMDGLSVKSCTVLAVQADDSEIVTIEGLSDDGGVEDPEAWHPVQRAFQQHHALQCGYCTPGMIMSAVDLLAKQPDADREEVRHGLEGNLCRCTGYETIVDAVLAAQQELAEDDERSSR